MICTRPTAARFAIRAGIDRCGNPNARVRFDVPATSGLLVILCDACALHLKVRYRAETRRRAAARAAFVTLLVVLAQLVACMPPPKVIDARDVRCVVVRDEQGAAYCVTEKELQSVLVLVLAERRAHAADVHDLNKPGF